MHREAFMLNGQKKSISIWSSLAHKFRNSIFAIFLPFSLLVVLASAYLFYQQLAHQKDAIKENGILDAISASHVIERSLAGSVRDILYLANDQELLAAAAKKNHKQQDLQSLLKELSLFAALNPKVHRIRWVDDDGLDILNIKNDKGLVEVLGAAERDDISDRYYFKKTVGLAQGQVYVSPLDLEFVHGKLTEPYQPLVRISTPVFDRQGRRNGILVVAIDAQDFLSHLKPNAMNPDNHLMLLNRDGYWLKGRNPEEEWGFMFNRARTFASEYSSAWKEIAFADQGSFEDESGLWSFQTVYPLRSEQSAVAQAGETKLGEYYWKVVSFVPREKTVKLHYEVMWAIGYPALGLLLLVFVGSWAYVRLRKSKQVTERDLGMLASALEINEAILIADADCNILRVNQAFSEVTGYSAEEVLGKNPSILKSDRQDETFYQGMWNRLLQDGYWEGEIWDRRKNGEIYPALLKISTVPDHTGGVSYYVSTFSDISERKASEGRISFLSFYDPLTELPNRKYVMDRLAHIIRADHGADKYAAIISIDLDNFKKINEGLGFGEGDQLLVEATKRIKSCIVRDDSAARVGVDEFFVLQEDLSGDGSEGASQVERIAQRIRASLSQPYLLKDNTCKCTASIGVTLFRVADATLDEILRRVEVATFRAKQAGGDAVRFFDPVTQKALEKNLALELDLRSALGNKELLLCYQLQVDHHQQPVGAEVLLRWVHPRNGVILPDEIIPLAEEIGLMQPISCWMFETVCQQIKSWEAYPILRDLVIAVNVSVRQFADAGFVEQLTGSITRSGINPARLQLELTEDSLVSDIDLVASKMRTIRGLGVKFALDDFGTGYSSLTYLKRLPLDQLKIDKSFVRDVTTNKEDLAIVKTIISMSHTLGLNVIAEGVETQEQMSLLEQSGCMNFQGYLFSRPLPVSEFEGLFA
ncbi:MAG TPA: EAL domain-containing protein [Gallionella sp.]|nr:EAL domain-containing protein [Gallionella sp.]